MIEISRAQLEMIANWFLPETPGPFVGAHVLNTGYGSAWVDRWPEPQVVAVETNDNFILMGNPNALSVEALRHTVAGFVAAPLAFVPLLEETFPTMERWPRIIGQLVAPPIAPPLNMRTTAYETVEVHRFARRDAEDLEAISAESTWVTQTWGGGRALAKSGYGWGAWVDGELAAVACTFFLGNAHEDIGVATEAGYRGLGLSTACCYALCQDIIARRRTPTWATSPANIASWRVAEKLGFERVRDDWLYVVGRPVSS